MPILNFIFCLFIINFTFELIGSTLIKIFFDKKKYIFNIKISCLNFFIGLIIASNILVFLNFFISFEKIKNPIILILLLLTLLIFSLIKKIEIFKQLNIWSYIFATIFSIPAISNQISNDAYMYHLYSQNLITNSKITFGISNFFPHYGILSILEYPQSLILNLNTYYLVQSIVILIIANFLNLMIQFFRSENLILKNFSIVFILVGFLDNFGFGGGRNGFIFIDQIGKFDSSYAIFFLLTYLMTFYCFKLEVNRNELLTLLLFFTYLFQIRSFGALMIFLIAPLYRKIKLLKTYDLIFLLLINFFWILKNVITTACIIFPIEFTCFSKLSWYTKGVAEKLSNDSILNNRNPNSVSFNFFNFDWVSEFWIENSKSFTINILISIIFIFIVYKSRNLKLFIDKTTFLFILFQIFMIIIWFLFFPHYRFLIGIVLSIYFILSALPNDLIVNFKSKYFYILFLIIVIFIPRLNSYFYFLNNLQNTESISTLVETNNLNYIDRVKNYGVKPKSGFCNERLDCSISETKVVKYNKYNYEFFKVEE